MTSQWRALATHLYIWYDTIWYDILAPLPLTPNRQRIIILFFLCTYIQVARTAHTLVLMSNEQEPLLPINYLVAQSPVILFTIYIYSNTRVYAYT